MSMRRSPHLLALAGALCVLVLFGVAARAQVSVSPTLGFDGTLYSYSYSVANPTALDLALVSVGVLSQPNAVLNPTAPAGFLISFDPGVGLVSFLEDLDPATPQTFAAGTTVSGFTFQSPFSPSLSRFEALDLAGNTFTGPTLGPNAIPEPSTLLLGLAVLPGLFFLPRRLRRR
jgi:hypothetical protein